MVSMCSDLRKQMESKCAGNVNLRHEHVSAEDALTNVLTEREAMRQTIKEKMKVATENMAEASSARRAVSAMANQFEDSRKATAELDEQAEKLAARHSVLASSDPACQDFVSKLQEEQRAQNSLRFSLLQVFGATQRNYLARSACREEASDLRLKLERAH